MQKEQVRNVTLLMLKYKNRLGPLFSCYRQTPTCHTSKEKKCFKRGTAGRPSTVYCMCPLKNATRERDKPARK